MGKGNWPQGEFLRLLARYWRTYGGFKALVLSPYFLFSCAFTLAVYPTWLCGRSTWVQTAIGVIPAIIGFSLGGYTIFLAFGGEKFQQTIAGKCAEETEESPFMKINATFLHFILVSVIALLSLLWLDAWKVENVVVNEICYLLYVYAISLSFATAFGIFMLSTVFDDVITHKRNGRM